MKDLFLDIIPLIGCVTATQVTEWVGLICTVVITLVTCGVNAYRIIRDRNIDKGIKKGEQNGKEN